MGKGEIRRGMTEYSVQCAECGLDDAGHRFNMEDYKENVLLKRGWKKVKGLWVCRGCVNKK